ncbi:hypothetical protein VNO77_33304 [Canavalia gladiata]|uniref:Uncharacterized protein n=1 Tax=Canavalia gladiata TaxID=3824 RepID=A0AAN9KDH7_CANGL
MDITGWVAYVIHQKMKSLKKQIKDRNKIVLGNLPNKITKLNEEIRTIKLQIKEGDDSVSLHEKKLAKLGSLMKSVTQPDAMIHQKSKKIEETVGLRDGAKSPSLDGYAYAFYKKFCHLLMEDIFLTFQKFHQVAKLPINFTSYFLTLIPKATQSMSINQYRPISLLGNLYMPIAKALTNSSRG